MSNSIALKSNSSEEFIYFLNFENYDGNIELIDIKTGEIVIDNLFDVLWEFYFEFIQNSQIQVIQLKEKSQFLIAAYASEIYYENDIYILYWIVTLDNSANEKVSFDSLFITESMNFMFIIIHLINIQNFISFKPKMEQYF